MKSKTAAQRGVITLSKKNTKLWESSTPASFAFRKTARAKALNLALRLGHNVEIYAAASEGGWVADIVDLKNREHEASPKRKSAKRRSTKRKSKKGFFARLFS